MAAAMRVLTVRHPWAEAIIHAGKDVENRPRSVAGDYRGPVAIHAGLYRPSRAEIDLFEAAHPEAARAIYRARPDREASYGVILGVVQLVGVHAWPLCRTEEHLTCSEWAYADGVHLELADARALPEPMLYTGTLGLRHLDADTTARILAQIGETA